MSEEEAAIEEPCGVFVAKRTQNSGAVDVSVQLIGIEPTETLSLLGKAFVAAWREVMGDWRGL